MSATDADRDENPNNNHPEKDYAKTNADDVVPVEEDSNEVEGAAAMDEETANSDAQLERDDADAIDESNIIKDRTRGAAPEGGYKEPGEEDIPEE